MKRIIVAGLGLVGPRHAAAVVASTRAELVAVVDPDARKRKAHGVPGFATLGEVGLAADGVILATPTELHAAGIVEAAARGWAVLVEKPLAASRPEAERAIAAARDGRVAVLVGHHRRHHASVVRLRDIIAGGRIGRPVLASLIWSVRKPAGYFHAGRAGAAGSPVRVNLVHDIDLLRFLFGEVRELRALEGGDRRRAGRTESGVAALAFESGVTASIAFADCAASPWGFEAATGENPGIAATGQDMLFVSGTRGAVSFPSLTLWRGGRDWSEASRPERQTLPHGDAIAAQLEHFLDVLDGAAPLVSVQDGAAALDVALAIEAALSGSRTRV